MKSLGVALWWVAFSIAVTASASAGEQLSFDPETGSLSGSAAATISPREFARSLDTETIEDLSVKVLGGFLTVKRTWDGTKWEFFPALKALQFEGGEASPTVIIRSSARYLAVPGSNPRRYARSGESLTQIVQNPSGWRWEFEDGSWVQYDPAGLAMAHGDRNQVQSGVLRDGQGRLRGFADHLGREVITLEYDGSGHLIKTRDYSSREVTYGYTNDRLTTITDVRGNVWHEDVGTNRVVTDPEGRVVTHYYSQKGDLTAIKDQDGFGVEYQYEFQQATKQFYLLERHSGNRVVETWFDQSQGVVRQDVNGRTRKRSRTTGNVRASVDADGNETKFDLDDTGRVVAIHKADGTTVRMGLSTLGGLPDQFTDASGVVTKYERDARGNVTRVTEAFGTPEQRVTVLTYDGLGQVLTRTQVVDGGAGDRKSTYTYDSYGNLATSVDAESNTRSMEYDASGNLTKLTDPRGGVWLYRFDAASHLVGTTNPLLATTTREYDKVGNLVRSVDEKGAETLFFYNARNQPTRLHDALGHDWTRSYNAGGQVQSSTDAEGRRVSYEYDLDGRLSGITDGEGVAVGFERLYGHTEANPQAGGLSKTHFPTYTREVRFDALGHPVSSSEVDSQGARRTSTRTFDALGSVTSVTSPDGRTIRTRFDSFRQPIEVTQTDNSVVSFSRLLWNRQLTVTDPRGKTTVITRDKLDRVVSERRPGGQTTHYEYDASDNVSAVVKPDGQRIEFTYDLAGRMTGLSSATRSATFTYNPRGELLSYSDGQSTGTVTYDALGRTLTRNVNVGAFTKGFEYSHYANGFLKTTKGPDGVSYGFAYDAANRLQRIDVPNEGAISYEAYRWHQPTRVTLPGGTTREYAYDDFMRVTSLRASDPSGTTFIDRGYGYDSVDQLLDQSTEHGAYHYEYDAARRLKSADYPTLPDESYGYDASGNRSPATGTPWTYGNNDELQVAGADSYEYDANGNRTRKTGPAGEVRYFYDEFDRLTRVESPEGTVVARYAYDPFGERLWKEVGGERTYFLHGNEGLAAELNDSGGVRRSYLYAPGDGSSGNPVLLRDASGTHYAHNDRLGMPLALTTSSGAKTWTATYAAYGGASVGTSQVTNPIRLPGQFFDSETGLHQNSQRDYDPTTGRYLEADPLGVGANRTLAVREVDLGWSFHSLYAYAASSPLHWTDPRGLSVVARGPVVRGGPPPLPWWHVWDPPGPNEGDQWNPGGTAGDDTRDYTDWYNLHYPKTVQGATDLFHQRIVDRICEQQNAGSSSVPGMSDPQSDVDVSDPYNNRFGDPPQTPYQANVTLGSFEMKTDPVNVQWQSVAECGIRCFTYTTTMYVWENTGDNRVPGFDERHLREAEWPLSGGGCCGP